MSGLENYTDTIKNLAGMILAEKTSVTVGELHGFICGVLATGARPDRQYWKKELAAMLDLASVPADFGQQAAQLAEVCLQKLCDKEFNFQLLLPDTEVSREICQNLCTWCEGFLHGFGIGKFTGKLLPTSSEALTDFAEIAQLDTELPDADTETDAQLFEVQEYVRVAALNIFIECSGDIDVDIENHQVH
ncbi:MAG: UPF0149 family protein [Gammaproteobacteria bacterium]|nr:UPF0149 family protein [Gammaproteobacteria bacterium]